MRWRFWMDHHEPVVKLLNISSPSPLVQLRLCFTVLLCAHPPSLQSPVFTDINTPEFPPGCASTLTRLRRVPMQRPLRGRRSAPPFGSKCDRRRCVVINVTDGGKETGRQIKLDDVDLMALQFGRLLGESKEKTLAKVVRKKLDPDATYVELEKLTKRDKESLRPLSKSDLVNYQIQIDKPKKDAGTDAVRRNASCGASSLPSLASPPLRQKSTVRKSPQAVKLGSTEESTFFKRPQFDVHEVVDESLLRKPSLTQSLSGVTSNIHQNSKMDAATDSKKQDVSSAAYSSPNLSSPPVRQNGALGNFSKAVQLGSRAISLPNQRLEINAHEGVDEPLLGKPFLTESLMGSVAVSLPTELVTTPLVATPKMHAVTDATRQDASSAAPSILNLTSPPVRHRGSRGLFPQEVQSGSRGISSSNQGQQLDGIVDEYLLCKPSLTESLPDSVAASSSTEEVTSPMFVSTKVGAVSDATGQEASSSVPNLTSPPLSRKGSQGLFPQTVLWGSRAMSSSNQGPHLDAHEIVHETPLRKPSLNHPLTADSVASAVLMENVTSPDCMSRQKQTLKSAKKSSPDESLSCRPSVTKANTEADKNETDFKKTSNLPLKLQSDFLHSEGSPCKLIEEKPSSLRSRSEITHSFQEIEESECKLEEVPQEFHVKVSGNTLCAASPQRNDSEDKSTNIFEMKESGKGAFASNSGQFREEGPFVIVPEGKSQLIVEGPLVEEKQPVDMGADKKLHLKLSRPKASNGVADSNKLRDKSFKENQQSRPQNLMKYKVSTSNRLAQTSSLHKEEVFTSEDARSMLDGPKKSARVHESDSGIHPESRVDMVKGVGLENTFEEKGNAVDTQFLHADFVPSMPSFSMSERVPVSSKTTLPRQGENMETLRSSDAGSIANFLEQVSEIPSKELESKQQRLDQGKAVLDSVFPDSLEDFSSTNRVRSNNLEQGIKPLQNPMRLPFVGSTLQPLQARGVGTSKGHQAKDDGECDWTRAEALLKSKEQTEVKLRGSNTAGLFVSFGCLMGFLPIFELSSKRGLPEFSTWAKQRGFDLSHRIGSKNGGPSDTGHPHISIKKDQGELVVPTEAGLKDLRNKYNEEMSKLLASFVGEKARVVVKAVDQDGRRLKFSERDSEPDCRDLVQKKAELMANLKVGDAVICEVKSITPIGFFVELHGVSALIHHSEVSWNIGVDPKDILSVGEAIEDACLLSRGGMSRGREWRVYQVIKARVCRLDRVLQRINLSLKQMQPDPLMKTLESVVGDLENDTSVCRSEVIESEVVMWPELEDLIKELEEMKEIISVSKGRCLRSIALAPTFQVFLSTPQDGGYKLLARFGNKIQEVLVNTALDRERMKEIIRTCTFAKS